MQHRKSGFTANHLTAIIIAAIFATVPGTLWAVDAFTNVAIQDPFSGHKARVDNTRFLRVYDSVNSSDKTPWEFVRLAGIPVNLSLGCQVWVTPPAGKALILTSVVVNSYKNPTPGLGEFVRVNMASSADCSANPSTVFTVNPGGIETQDYQFDPGIVVPAGQSLRVSAGGSVRGELYGSGYLVPAGWATGSHVLSDEHASFDEQQTQQKGLGNRGQAFE